MKEGTQETIPAWQMLFEIRDKLEDKDPELIKIRDEALAKNPKLAYKVKHGPRVILEVRPAPPKLDEG